MKQRAFFKLLTACLLMLSAFACESSKDNPGNTNPPEGSGSLVNVKISPQNKHQTIDGFGASDAWRAQFVGKNWPLDKREAMADLLFSREVDQKGNPKGIGLSIWRFYIGAGSKEQGDDSGIANAWRRAPSFLDADGNWDWTKYEGQRWFLQAAKERGVNHLLAFTISPPVFMTKNGKAYSPGGKEMNIQQGKIDDYADFLVEIMDHFQNQENLPFDYLSPVNEPQWDWNDGGQEGTPATNSEISQFVKLISKRLDERGLSTQITLGEAGNVGYLYKEADKPERDNQIDAFFNPTSDNYVGDLPNMKPIISSHSYFTTWPVSTLLEERRKLAAKIQQVNHGLGYWQSEFCILQDNDDIGGGWDRDLGMNTALYVARVIHYDMTLANARSWQWWTALSQFDFKDGLIYLDAGGNGARSVDDSQMESLKHDGNYHDSKLLWALGNYSRFVRPGMKRIEAENLTNAVSQPTNLMVSAYRDDATGRVAMVFVNYSEDEKPVNLDFGEAEISNNELETYTTSSTMDLKRQTVDVDSLVIPSRSVVTAITKLNL